jgi:hypothetical protein
LHPPFSLFRLFTSLNCTHLLLKLSLLLHLRIFGGFFFYFLFVHRCSFSLPKVASCSDWRTDENGHIKSSSESARRSRAERSGSSRQIPLSKTMPLKTPSFSNPSLKNPRLLNHYISIYAYTNILSGDIRCTPYAINPCQSRVN